MAEVFVGTRCHVSRPSGRVTFRIVRGPFHSSQASEAAPRWRCGFSRARRGPAGREGGASCSRRRSAHARISHAGRARARALWCGSVARWHALSPCPVGRLRSRWRAAGEQRGWARPHAVPVAVSSAQVRAARRGGRPRAACLERARARHHGPERTRGARCPGSGAGRRWRCGRRRDDGGSAVSGRSAGDAAACGRRRRELERRGAIYALKKL